MTIREILRPAARAFPASPSPDSDDLLGDDVALAVVDDGTGRLLDLAGNFYALTASATAMLREVLSRGRGAAAGVLAAKFGADPALVAADLADFLAELAGHGLLRRRSDPPRAARRCVREWLVASCLRLAGGLRLPLGPRANVLLALAYLSVRLLGWPAAGAIDRAVRAGAATHLLNVECKERGLVCWSLLRAYRLAGELVVGVDLLPFSSHCWCRLGPRVVGDFPDRCGRFTAVWVYD